MKRRVFAEQMGGDAHYRLLQSIDPGLILGVQRVVSALELSCFPVPQNPLESRVVPTREMRERELVPYAVIAASVRVLLRMLVNGSLQAMDARVEGAAKPLVAGSAGPKKRLLVPAHVMRGLVEGVRRRGSKEVHWALLLSMARLGVVVENSSSQTEPQNVDGVLVQTGIHASEAK